MKTHQLLSLIFLAVLFHPAVPRAQSWSWAERMGGTGADGLERIVSTPDLGYAAAGKFSGAVWLGNDLVNSMGIRDILVLRYDLNGTLQWARTAGGTENDEGLAVAADDSGNVIVTGFFRGTASFGNTQLTTLGGDEMFVARYNAAGDLCWVRTGQGPGEARGKGVTCDAQGNVLVTGYYFDTCYFDSLMLVSPGLDNVFLAKYNPQGQLLWVLDGGSPSETWASCVGVNAAGEAWISGSFEGTAAFGQHTITSFGGNDVFLVKASGSGTWLQALHAGGSLDDFGNGLFVSPGGWVAVTGSLFSTVQFSPSIAVTSNGNKDGFAALYDPAGTCLWARNFGGTSSDKGIEVAIGTDGYTYVTGFTNGVAVFDSISQTGLGGDDAFIAKYDAFGNIIYAELAGGTSQDYGKGITLTWPGTPVIAGDFGLTAGFGTHSLTSLGDRDGFVARYADGSPYITSQPQPVSCCTGDTVSLVVSASGTPPLHYLWFDAAGSILGAVDDTFRFCPLDPSWSGHYYCVISNGYGSIDSDTAYVAVYPIPGPDLGPDRNHSLYDSLILVPGGPFSSYLWSTGDTTSSLTYHPSSLGVVYFSVTVTNAGGCSASDTVRIEVVSIGMQELLHGYGIRCFPNPGSDMVFLDLGIFPAERLEMFASDGSLVYRSLIHSLRTTEIPLHHLAAGTYSLQLISKDGLHLSLKVLKE
ncbi:MAG TPA: hypothetical protein P5550_01585 [Bacteroidales bacterium]|nr:hypothetical protein [Bacteroidales bacterium]HRZ76825.1 hypothetical protein [Bacteroidales bacterium]